MTTRRVGVFSLLVAYITPSAAWGFLGGELLINGSFESPVLSTIDQEFTAPSTDIDGWVLSERTVDITRTSSIFGTAHSGDQMIDVNGSDNGTLQQSFSSTIGNMYLLSLYYANNPNPSLASPVYNADVTLFGSGTLYSEFLAHAGSTPTDMKWSFLSHTFVADSSTTILQLQSRMLGFNGVVFDSVSVIRVPEPSAAVLAISSVVVLWRRFRTEIVR